MPMPPVTASTTTTGSSDVAPGGTTVLTDDQRLDRRRRTTSRRTKTKEKHSRLLRDKLDAGALASRGNPYKEASKGKDGSQRTANDGTSLQHQVSIVSDDAIVMQSEDISCGTSSTTSSLSSTKKEVDKERKDANEAHGQIANVQREQDATNDESDAVEGKLGVLKEAMVEGPSSSQGISSSRLSSSAKSSNSNGKKEESHHNHHLNDISDVARAVVSKLQFRSSSTRKGTPPPADQLIYREMTPIGQAAYHTLTKHHSRHKKKSWNLTKSTMVGGLWNTPQNTMATPGDHHHNYAQPGIASSSSSCPSQPHDEWLPKEMGNLIATTERWCDITSLSPPDGLFLKEFQRGLGEICQRQLNKIRGHPQGNNDNNRTPVVTVRIMFGNIVASPIDCNAFIRILTSSLPPHSDQVLQLWVGSWRKGVSWNHSKIIAVDGRTVITGGHNLWTHHYLMADPVHDVSLKLEGDVAVDAHLYTNKQWKYISRKQSSCWGHFVDQRVPDAWEVPRVHRVTVSEYPFNVAAEFPPPYEPMDDLPAKPQQWKVVKSAKNRLLGQIGDEQQTSRNKDKKLDVQPSKEDKATDLSIIAESSKEDLDPDENHPNGAEAKKGDGSIPVLSIGRYGAIVHKDRPADDAFVAMIDACQSSIRLAVQDIGPMRIPGTSRPVPGTTWPKSYLNALGRAIWKRRVVVEIVLSNPDSLPGHLDGPGEFVYGNGWKTYDVADEIILAIQRQFRSQSISMDDLKDRIRNNLRICYLRAAPTGSTHYPCGQTIGLHAKHYIFDDTTCYIGSQNLYDCDLAEWGVVLDSPFKVQELKRSFWDPMWETSYRQDDCSVDQVMDGLQINREDPDRMHLAKPFHWGCCQTADAVVETGEGQTEGRPSNRNERNQRRHNA